MAVDVRVTVAELGLDSWRAVGLPRREADKEGGNPSTPFCLTTVAAVALEPAQYRPRRRRTTGRKGRRRAARGGVALARADCKSQNRPGCWNGADEKWWARPAPFLSPNMADCGADRVARDGL